ILCCPRTRRACLPSSRKNALPLFVPSTKQLAKLGLASLLKHSRGAGSVQERRRPALEDEMRPVNRMTIMAAIAAVVSMPVLADDHAKTVAKDSEKLQKAEQVLRASLEAPDKGIPKDALEKAECVGVFPDVAKGAFIVGGQGGVGVFSCRDASGKMGAPAFFKIGGGSVGWQFGGQQTDL